MNQGLGNRITPYKGRKIDFKSEVEVYRCLTRKGKIYSIRQNHLVVAHTTCLMMRNVQFFVNKSGQNRARMTNQRNVHAYMKGRICLHGAMGVTAEAGEGSKDALLPANITYNPFKHDTFIIDNLTSKPSPIFGAMAVAINSIGVRAAYTFPS